MNWLSALLQAALSSAFAKVAKDLFADFVSKVLSWFAAGKFNKKSEEEAANAKKDAEKLKEDLKKAGDDVKSQEDAIDDFFNHRR